MGGPNLPFGHATQDGEVGNMDETKPARGNSKRRPGLLPARIRMGRRSTAFAPRALAAARPNMIATLDRFRDMLDGDTDPVSGPVVLELK